MNWKLFIGGLLLLGVLVFLKRKFDPHNDAFRTEDREGWYLKKANVISLADYKKRRRAQNE